MSIRIIDNFLSDEEFSSVEQGLKSLPWAYSDRVSGPDDKQVSCDPKYDWQMVHYFYEHPFNISDHVNVIGPVINKINPILIYRAKLNLNPVTSEHIEHGYHLDFEPEEFSNKFMSAVYYINTNNGYTKFDNGDTVKSEANRLVIFPTTVKHTGSTCTDEKNRMVLNLMYVEGYPIA